jgi:phosphoribosylpyrophosphate synthetase
MSRWVKENIPDWRDAIIVSPDAGGAKRFVLILHSVALLVLTRRE